MLVLKNIYISYKSQNQRVLVIKNLSLQIQKGEALVILGASGCGKSTLINALAGIKSIDKGSVEYIKGNDIKALSPKYHRIGVIPQNFGLLPWKTVRDNCILPLKIRKEVVSLDKEKEISKVYEALDIITLLNRFPRQLSGGQAQRAAIARAFILMPDLLLMDEPFSALDAITREEAIELFLMIWKQNRPTTILVTHNIDEALYLGNRIIVMGNQMGEINYELNNKFFGKSNPDSIEYIKIKYLLRTMLNKGEKPNE